MSPNRFILILVVGLFQVCQAAEVVDLKHKSVAANQKALFARQMINLATGGYRPIENTVPNGLYANSTFSPTGFLSMSYSYDADCANTVIGYGYPVDSCIMDVGYAIKFQLIQDSCIGGIVEYFRDEECTMLAGTSDLDGFNNACSVAEQSLLGDSETSYAKLQCTTNAVPTVAMDSGILETFTNNTDCETSADYSYLAFSLDQCITLTGTTFTVSCNGDAMVWNVDVDGTPDCQGDVFPVTWSDTCDVQGESTDDFDDVYNPPFINPPPSVSTTPFPTSGHMTNNDSQISYCQVANTPSAEPSAEPTALPTTPTAVPTMAPTFVPTRMPSTMAPSTKPSTGSPTTVVSTVSFMATQIINGISIDTYNTDPTLYSNTLKETIAASMEGVTPANIIYLEATAYTDSTSAISITYTVEVATQLTVEDLENQLITSVMSGMFTTMLQSNAAANGATGLETATADSVVIIPTAPTALPTPAPTLTPTRMPSTMAPSAKPSTAYPTSAAITTVSFKAAQVVSGISVDTYNTNTTLYGNTLKQTIAASMEGVTPANIKNLLVTASAASSIQQTTLGVATGVASLLQVKAATVRKSLRTVMSTSAISVTYTVEVATQLTVEDLESQLSASVETGVFTDMLQSNAAANGATGLETASSDSVVVTADSSDGGNNGLSDGAIAGIVIGCVAGVVLIAGVIFYFSSTKKSLLSSPNVEL